MFYTKTDGQHLFERVIYPSIMPHKRAYPLPLHYQAVPHSQPTGIKFGLPSSSSTWTKWLIIGAIVLISIGIVLTVTLLLLLPHNNGTALIDQGILYHVPLNGNYRDVTRTSFPQLLLPTTTCLPAFINMLLPNGKIGLAWNNPCSDPGQAILLDSMTTVGNSYSMCGWFNFNAFPSGKRVSMLFGSSDTSQPGWIYTQLCPIKTSDPTLTIQNYHSIPGGSGMLLPQRIFIPPLQLNQWYHICTTYDDSSLTSVFYLNGQVSISPYVSQVGNPPWNSFPHSRTLVGGWFTGGYGFQVEGSIYEIRIYNLAVPASTVLDIFADQSGGQSYPVYPPSLSFVFTPNTTGSGSSNGSSGGSSGM